MSKRHNHNEALYRVVYVDDRPDLETKEVGLEIEVEGRKLLTGRLPVRDWSFHNDGSLRAPEEGDMTAEYVLTRPLDGDEIDGALQRLLAALEKNGAEYHNSFRTSVHVHLNYIKSTPKKLLTMLCVYYILEDLLTEWAGEFRSGNRFCLRAKDAPYIIWTIRNNIKNDTFSSWGGDRMRYAACNLAALNKFLSVEFRALAGTMDRERIMTWVNILLAIKNNDYKDPQEVVKTYSQLGAVGFLNRIFGMRGVPTFLLGAHNRDQRMYEGVRLAQDIAFARRDWPENTAIEKKKEGPKHATPAVFDIRDPTEPAGAVEDIVPVNNVDPGLVRHGWVFPYQALPDELESVDPVPMPRPAAAERDERRARELEMNRLLWGEQPPRR